MNATHVIKGSDTITTYDAITLPPIIVDGAHHDEPTAEQRMRIVEASGTLDFWGDTVEDVFICTQPLDTPNI